MTIDPHSRRPTCQPACSVVIPCYDAAATIAATLESARRQSNSNIEIIVVDDGSRDAGPDLVAAIAASDRRVRLIRQSNAGVASARNAGIAAASARVIAFLDSDDLWAVDHLQTHLRRLQNDPRLGVSYSPARFIDTHGTIIGQSNPKLGQLTPVDLLLGNPTTTCSTLVIRREVFSDVGMFRTNMRHNEDQEWLFRVALSGWGFAGDPTPRVDYRTSPTGLAADLDGMFRGFETMLREARKLAPQLVERNTARATANMHRYLARRAIRLGVAQSIARRYIFAAITTRPIMLLLEPHRTWPTLAAAMVPQAVMLPVLQYVRAASIHA